MRRPLALSVALLCLAGCSCESAHRDEQRRALLRPPDVHRMRVEQPERVRLVDDRGDLIASDQVVAGITLPRGFTRAFAVEHASYYQSRHASLEQLDRYFTSRLSSKAIERGAGTIRYLAARPMGRPGATAVTVLIGEAPHAPGTQEIHIVEPRPRPSVPLSDTQMRAQMEARRKFAD